ncbi:MAG: ROK family protein, partial [Chloroflexi bacterium]|nr:ROK family protein [Chloroflexota bacterium]
MPIWGAIEAGGTNFVCGVGSGPHDLVREEFATGSPEATINRAAAFLKQHGPLLAVGVGSFGPVDLRRGSITTTPKQGWQNVPFVEMLHRELG